MQSMHSEKFQADFLAFWRKQRICHGLALVVVMSRNLGAKKSLWLGFLGQSCTCKHQKAHAREGGHLSSQAKTPDGKGDIICPRKQKSIVTYLRTSCKIKKIWWKQIFCITQRSVESCFLSGKKQNKTNCSHVISGSNVQFLHYDWDLWKIIWNKVAM